jgi:hypothetical protein
LQKTTTSGLRMLASTCTSRSPADSMTSPSSESGSGTTTGGGSPFAFA